MQSECIKMVKPCWKSYAEGDGNGYGCGGGGSGDGDPNGKSNGLMWYKDLGYHTDGEFSMAVIQANALLEDQCQLESGPLSFLDSGPCGTFIGVYDGHGGPETSRFVNDNLFFNLKSTFIFLFPSYSYLSTTISLHLDDQEAI